MTFEFYDSGMLLRAADDSEVVLLEQIEKLTLKSLLIGQQPDGIPTTVSGNESFSGCAANNMLWFAKKL